MAAITFISAEQKNGSPLASLVGSFTNWNDRRLTRNSLNRLSTRQLDDIGLVRGDIEEIANGVFIR